MQVNFNPGDLVRYTYYADDWTFEVNEVAQKFEEFGIVVRGGQHNALVLLNGQAEAGWINDEYLEVVSNAG